MLGLFKKKDPADKLKKQYQKMMEDAMNLQRNGDIQGYAKKMEEADSISKQIEDLSK